jgi:hypothetical protein
MANEKDGGRVILSSYGMMAVDLASPSGERLQVKSGSKATITSPIPSSLQSSAPSSIALWSVNETTGIWQEEGTAQKNGSVYTGEVSHFSFWNCDIGLAGVTVSLTVNDPDGDPLVHAWVKIRTTGPNPSWSYGFTDSLGQVSGFVPANQSLVLEVLNFCFEPIYTQNIGPFNQNTNLGVISLPVSSTSSVRTIKGTLKDCANNIVTNGYAIIYYGYNVRFVEPDANGVFEADFIVCNSSTTTFQVLGVDEVSGQQSNMYTGTIGAAVNDIGIVSACGNSAAQYINFTLDGTSYSITDASDSIGAYTQPLGGTTTGPYYTSISGWQNTSGGGNISFSFEHAIAGPGTYPMATLNVQTFQQAVLSNTSSVTITSYPANVGDFYEGTFSAAFTVGTTVHNVTNAQFRIRRNF